MQIGIPKQIEGVETRTSITPDVIQRFLKKYPDLNIVVEKGAGTAAGFEDSVYEEAGAKVGTAKQTMESDIVFVVSPKFDASGLKKGA